MQAPILMQHYLTCKASAKCSPLILDQVRYIREALNEKDFLNHLFERQEGFGSEYLLQRLLQSHSAINNIRFKDIDADQLRRHGPVLVSTFAIPVDFCAEGNHLSFLGSESPTIEPLWHAMLIIGVRDEDGSRRFLMQNWWPGCQFFEADANFLDSGYAPSRAIQVITPQINQSAAAGAFWRPGRLYTEAADVDMEERPFFRYNWETPLTLPWMVRGQLRASATSSV